MYKKHQDLKNVEVESNRELIVKLVVIEHPLIRLTGACQRL